MRIRYRDGNWRPRTLVAVPLGGGWVALHPPRDGVIVLSPLHVGRLRACLRVAVMASAEQDPDAQAWHGATYGFECWDPPADGPWKRP